MIDPDDILPHHAAIASSQVLGSEGQGSLVIAGNDVDWWSNHTDVWFYNPGNDGENTIKRFSAKYLEA